MPSGPSSRPDVRTKSLIARCKAPLSSASAPGAVGHELPRTGADRRRARSARQICGSPPGCPRADHAATAAGGAAALMPLAGTAAQSGHVARHRRAGVLRLAFLGAAVRRSASKRRARNDKAHGVRSASPNGGPKGGNGFGNGGGDGSQNSIEDIDR